MAYQCMKTWLYMAETQRETVIKEQFPNEVISVLAIGIWKHNSRSRHTLKSVSSSSKDPLLSVVGFLVGGYLEWRLLDGEILFWTEVWVCVVLGK